MYFASRPSFLLCRLYSKKENISSSMSSTLYRRNDSLANHKTRNTEVARMQNIVLTHPKKRHTTEASNKHISMRNILLWFSVLFLYFIRYLTTEIPYFSVVWKLEKIDTNEKITTDTVACTETIVVQIPLKLLASISTRQMPKLSITTPVTNRTMETIKMIISFLLWYAAAF